MAATATASSKSPAAPVLLPSLATRPFLKWAGSKSRVRAAFLRYYPALGQVSGYHEPFLGSGAVFFDVRRRFDLSRCTLSDNNAELIAAFTAVRDRLPFVIARLKEHARKHDEAYFYEMRAGTPADLDRMDPVDRAARLIYLNKTCFNGLYRVNSKGLFNVPMGRYVDPAILDEELLRAAHDSLQGVRINLAPFESVLERARPGDLVYFDPPYVPLSRTSYFTSYTEGNFGEADQRRLADVFRALDGKGCKVMLSNSNAKLVHELYADYRRVEIQARRNINSKSDRRGHVTELLVLNYDPPR